MTATQRAALESVIVAAKQAEARAQAVISEVLGALGLPQEARVMGLDEKGLIVSMKPAG